MPLIPHPWLRPLRNLAWLAVAASLLLTLAASAQPLAFPGAVGFGANATGGHSGTVYHVTNLNNSGTGSFTDAVSQSNRIIVFDVGGTVQLDGPISASGNLTIAGQTAPGGGIAIIAGETSFDGKNNVIARYVRFRDGSLDPNWVSTSATPSSHLNGVNLGTTNETIFDHCCFEFAAYNNIDATACSNCTIQYCIFADPIDEQQFNAHFETGPQTFIGNLMANSHGRNPLGKADLQFVNNVVYNYQYAMTTGDSSGNFHWDVINNYFIAGPSTTSATDDFYQVDSNQSAYSIGNLLDSNKDGILNGSSTGSSVNGATLLSSYWFNSTTTTNPTANLPTLTAATAFPVIVSVAGPFPRDQVDSQVVTQVLSLGTSGRLFGTQADTGLGNSGYGTITNSTAYVETNAAGGMPDYWLAALGLTLSADNHATAVGAYPSSYMPVTGYTALDEYCYFMGAPHAFSLENNTTSPANVSIDLSVYTNGFSSGSLYSLANITNGSAVLQADGHTVVFTPTQNFTGRANFDFTVNDGIGDTMTQTVRVIVTPLTPVTPAPPPPPAVLTWKGDGVSNNWDTTSLNWINSNSTVVAYTTGSNTTFTDAGSNSPSINLTTTLSPAAIAVTSAQSYTLTGSGLLSGTMTVTQSGTGNFTIFNTGVNSYTGNTTISSGTLTVASNTTAPLGTGTIALAGGTLNITSNNGITMANNFYVTGNSTITQNASSNVYFSGPLNGNGTLNFGLGSGKLLSFSSGSTTGFTGTIEMGTSSGSLRFYGSGTSATGSGSAVFDVGTGTGTLYNRQGGTLTLGALEGGPNTNLTGAGSTNTSCTYNIGGLGQTTTFYGKVTNGSFGSNCTTGVNVVGGTFTFAGNYTSTGNLSVSGGTLVLSGNFPCTVQASAGGTLSLGGNNNPITLNVASMALSGGNYIFDLSNSPTGPNDQIVVTNNGTISTSGNNTFLINLLNGTLGDGVYTLVTTTGTLGAASGTGLFSNLSSTSRQTYALSRPASGTAPGYIRLTVSGGPASIVWTGAANGTWDNSTLNWSNAGSADKFYSLDAVSFGDTGTNTTITLPAAVQPGNLTFTNTNATSYTITGSGGISGTGQLVKTSSGTVTLNTSNTFSGGSLLSAGTVILGSATALGNGTVTLNGATLVLPQNLTLANTFLITAPSTLTTNGSNTFTSSVSGSGNLTLQIGGSQQLTFQGDESLYTGTILVQGPGTLRFNDSANWNLANATLNLTNVAVADNRSLTDITFTLGALAGDSTATFTASDQSAANGSVCTLLVGNLNLNTTFSGTIADSANQAIALTKVGTGNLTLAGNNTYSGDTAVQAGTLNVTGNISGDGDFNVASGATLNLVNASLLVGTLTIASNATLSGNGTINGEVVLNGSATSSLGGAITVNGDVTNNGVLRLTGGTQLSVSGTFTNNGILDLITSGSGVPANLVNNGTVLLASSVEQVSSFGVSGATATLQIQSYVGHNFQLQFTTTLGSAWQNIGSAQTGTGSILTFTDPSYAANPMIFYRILVSP
jgi:autotransporter-associated beta strand protein